MELKQRKICGTCRAYSLSNNNCLLGYNTKPKYFGGVGGPIIDSIPLEPCPKPATTSEFHEAKTNYKKSDQ